ncbi:GNAT family N-acetyltransferase [Acinetobacter pollinis]|uniref:GNAT family N-acetyltransferase n=1 Tax=Acinetobacter pollinis TaxID=2605270 RepID=UPI0018A30938|nr:GNAT family protein [Acinetobacter pollinis]MBF7690507.1 GNAT family N-acetyltransferase [Acinetobacter pollinis]MBF7697991.1 GNAT family N-acetyltransferase [Acinetobacter pollinis]
MSFVSPVQLCMNNIRIEPLDFSHETGLIEACKDGELWKLRITSTPHFTQVKEYIELAQKQRQEGSRFAFVVIDETSGKILGTTSYHDILASVKRVKIGYTWYAQSVQRTHVNTTCKLLLMKHAFETLQCNVVGLRTDIFNFKSQKAIERLGAKRDGIIRGDALRKDGTVRDTVMYSITAGEWANVHAHLLDLLSKYE